MTTITTSAPYTTGFSSFARDYDRERANGRNPGCLCGRGGHKTLDAADRCGRSQRNQLDAIGGRVGHIIVFFDGRPV